MMDLLRVLAFLFSLYCFSVDVITADSNVGSPRYLNSNPNVFSRWKSRYPRHRLYKSQGTIRSGMRADAVARAADFEADASSAFFRRAASHQENTRAGAYAHERRSQAYPAANSYRRSSVRSDWTPERVASSIKSLIPRDMSAASHLENTRAGAYAHERRSQAFPTVYSYRRSSVRSDWTPEKVASSIKSLFTRDMPAASHQENTRAGAYAHERRSQAYPTVYSYKRNSVRSDWTPERIASSIKSLIPRDMSAASHQENTRAGGYAHERRSQAFPTVYSYRRGSVRSDWTPERVASSIKSLIPRDMSAASHQENTRAGGYTHERRSQAFPTVYSYRRSNKRSDWTPERVVSSIKSLFQRAMPSEFHDASMAWSRRSDTPCGKGDNCSKEQIINKEDLNFAVFDYDTQNRILPLDF